MMLPEWVRKDGIIIDNMDKMTYGFVYCITYLDGKKYIGKKNVKSFVVKPSLKTKSHEGMVRKTFKFIYRDSDGKIVTSKRKQKKLKEQGVKPIKEYYDECVIESNWRTYVGSSSQAKERKNEIVRREILSVHEDSKNLSYWENYELFTRNVLFSDEYINDNIGGSFFRGQIKE